MRSIRALALACSAAVVSQAGAINLLTNPDFETGALAPWYTNFNGGGSPWVVQSGVVHGGSFAAEGIGNMGLEQDFTPTPVSQITQVAFWIKNEDPGALVNGVDLIYSDAPTTFTIVFEPNTDWFFFDATANLTPGKTLSGIQIYGFSGGSSAPDLTYVDDVVVNATPVPEPATLAVLGVGALAALRRRRR